MSKVFFIVGNSRSGTTMMLRMFDNHSNIYGLNELHFFEQLWSTADVNKLLLEKEAIALLSKLLFVQRDGYIGTTDSNKYKEEATKLLKTIKEESWIPHKLYFDMMLNETKLHQKDIPCEKTPQNVFYIEEILNLFPEARIINMIRDPRAILLSQKRKWTRRKMGATFITKRGVFRLRMNYHPITMSKLWNAAINAGLKHSSRPEVLNVKFEDLLENPKATVEGICNHLGLPFEAAMLDIPQASSSNEKDSDEKGVNKKRAGNWQKGGLSKAEIEICQNICGENMKALGYSIESQKVNPLVIAGHYLLFPIKLVGALLLNLNRMKSITETLKRRLKA